MDYVERTYNQKRSSGLFPNPEYHCKKCGIENDPFSYRGDKYKEMFKNNLCPKCLTKFNTKSMV